jgi:hypothetical protein
MRIVNLTVGAAALLLFGASVPAQRPANNGEVNIDYPGPKPKGLTPEVFAPGFITEPGAHVFNISFALDGQTIVYRRNRDNAFDTMIAEYKEGHWTKPQVAPPRFAEVPDFVTPSRAYYAVRDNIFALEKTADGWSDGKPLVEVKKSGPRMSVARSGNIYVPIFTASRGLDIAVVRWKDGAYQPPEMLPDSVNSAKNEEHLYVAPDERYLLFDSERDGGLGKSDLYISFHRPDGSWSQAKNLGATINTAEFDFNIRVSPDGKYLFYCSGADGQLHWVDFQAVLRSVEPPPLDYLGQAPPGDEPKVFAKGTVSVDGKNTHAVQFSPDGRLLLFSRYPDKTSFRMVLSESGWSHPEPTSFTGKEVSFDPVLKRLFYYDQGDLHFVRYGPDGFSSPTKLPATINTAGTEYYPSITAQRNLYFSRAGKWSDARIQVARLQDEGFGDPVDLGEPINAGGALHAFVSPDESYMLFNSPRAGSHTQCDIWVSFRNQDGSWGKPVNLGERINRDAQAVLCPTVSPDGKYLFFTRLQENGTGYVYWASTHVLDEVRRQRVAGEKE